MSGKAFFARGRGRGGPRPPPSPVLERRGAPPPHPTAPSLPDFRGFQFLGFWVQIIPPRVYKKHGPVCQLDQPPPPPHRSKALNFVPHIDREEARGSIAVRGKVMSGKVMEAAQNNTEHTKSSNHSPQFQILG